MEAQKSVTLTLDWTVPLFIVLFIFKVTGVIHWSWWIITLPLWGGFALFIALLALAGLMVGLAAVVEHFIDSRARRRRRKVRMVQKAGHGATQVQVGRNINIRK